MIELQNVTFAYPHRPPLIEGFSWRVGRGELWSVVGPSGCGKTTLLMLLTGLLRPTSGSVAVDGRLLRAPLPENGVVFQHCGLLPWATLRGNVELGLRIRRLQHWAHARGDRPDRREIRARAEHWLRRLGIADAADRFPSQVSGGQLQRAAIARTLATEARRLFLDEPFSALDARTREALREDTLALCREQDLSLVLVTHSVEEAALMGERTLVFGPRGCALPRVADCLPGPDPDTGAGLRWQRRCAALREMLT